MTAEEIAAALGATRAPRQTSRGLTWRIPCPALDHDDRHPSCDMTDTGALLLFNCRSRGCSGREIIDGLRARSLWTPERQPSRPIADPFLASAFHEPSAPPCCFEQASRCEHWQQFDADMLVARLHENLREAAAEVAGLFQTAGYELTNDELHDELNLAVELGGSAIVSWHMSAGAVAKMIDFVVAEVVGNAARAA